jgi:hypothetical protein
VVSWVYVCRTPPPRPRAVYITFGQVFLDGTVEPTANLLARINGANYAVQMDVKVTNTGGSARHAVLTVKVPMIAAGTTLDLMLPKGTALPPSQAAPTA